ncbi:hypothetical protein ABVK25_002232 [Lepraria finkii]|uniref:Uncharacterized protein n=1 Tax=Lepraria finkii TaxID=1340010 RepID=A0ABR4BH97_9LECA
MPTSIRLSAWFDLQFDAYCIKLEPQGDELGRLQTHSRQSSEILANELDKEDYSTRMSLVMHPRTRILGNKYLPRIPERQGQTQSMVLGGSVPCDEYASPYHEIYDVDDYKWKLTTVFTSDSKQLAENIVINEEDVVQANLFDEVKPDDEGYERWTGNEGASQYDTLLP